MKSLLAAFALLFTFSALPAQAETYEEATAALCEKVKQCALQNMRGEDMSAADERMMMDMMDNMCAGIQGNYNAQPNHPHYNKATQCMRSMADLSCAEFDGMRDENPTPECKAFRDAAE